MAHLHNITDTDKRFYIDHITRAVIPESDNVNPIQFDNNSVRFVFEVPRFVGGHDMSLCDKIEIHYINFASATEKSEDVYLVDDIAVDEWADDKASFTWLLSANATKYAGPLDFLIRFICLDGDKVIYAWHTDICKDISVCDGINNSAAAIELGTDILEAWRKEVLGGSEEAAKRAEEAATKAEAAAEEATERVEEAVKFATDKVEAATSESADRAEAAAEAAAAEAAAAADKVEAATSEAADRAEEAATRAEEAADRAESEGGVSTEFDKRLKAVENYEPIKFMSLKMEPSTTEYEHGSEVQSVKLKWSLNKAAEVIDVNDILVGPSDTEYVAIGPFTSDQEWEVWVREGGPKYETASRTAAISFYYLVYWGVGTQASGFDGDFVRKLQNNDKAYSKSRTFFVTPDAQYIYYAVPKVLCDTEPTFIIDNGFVGGFGFKSKEEVVVTNAYGSEIVYYVYRSDQLLVGSTRVDVS